MKVYIVTSIPDYIGVNIEGVFLNKNKAEKYCEELKQENLKLYNYDLEHHMVEEYEILE